MTGTTPNLQAWIGRCRDEVATAAVEPLRALNALLDTNRDLSPGAPLPPAWHWMYFVPSVRQSRLGTDGHPLDEEFMPPLPGTRRMWAGSRLHFRGHISIGDRLERHSEIVSIASKTGRSGAFTLVALRHLVTGDTGEIDERQDLVFRSPTHSVASEPDAAGLTDEERIWDERRLQPDPALLFRFSAVTFNAHRIHYDLPYARSEGYPSLVVQGPLMALLMLDQLYRTDAAAPIGGFNFRARQPAFVSDELLIQKSPAGSGFLLRVTTPRGVASEMEVVV